MTHSYLFAPGEVVRQLSVHLRKLIQHVDNSVSIVDQQELAVYMREAGV